MEFDSWRPQNINIDKPLYIAVADALEHDIRSGVLKPGQKLPTQRELSELVGVNLSTITRAFRECELRGLISATVGRGTYVASDINIEVSLTHYEEQQSDLLEMGLVLPLYELDKDTVAHIDSILPTIDFNFLLRYTQPSGLSSHREAGSTWVNRFGLHTTLEDIFVTAGSQHALACCLMSLFNAGDHIAVDALTYPGIKTLSSMNELRLAPIDMDKDGMNPDALSVACRRGAIRGIYLMPEVQNPTGSSMTADRRKQIAAIIKQYDLILIEDDAYGYTGNLKQTPLSALVPSHSIYIAGISKLLGAGFRISFAAVPGRFKNSIEKAILNTIWMASPINAEIVSKLLMSGRGESILEAKRKEANWRTALALEKLSPYTIASHANGFFLWLLLPYGWTGREFELSAREAGVRVFCAEKFAVGSKQVPSAVRISLTGPETREDLRRGLDILIGILARGYRKSEIIF